jgi:hypothetical protein
MIVFFTNSNNSVHVSTFSIYLSSSSLVGKLRDIKGMGLYIHENGFRRCIELFSARYLSKHTWIEDQYLYFAPKEKKR